jgi:hypothetical protein
MESDQAPEESEIAKARTFILWFLERRPAMVFDVVRAAKEQRISADAIFAARLEMPVRTFEVSRWCPVGFRLPPTVRNAKWFKCWELVPEDEAHSGNGALPKSYGILPGP